MNRRQRHARRIAAQRRVRFEKFDGKSREQWVHDQKLLDRIGLVLLCSFVAGLIGLIVLSVNADWVADHLLDELTHVRQPTDGP